MKLEEIKKKYKDFDSGLYIVNQAEFESILDKVWDSAIESCLKEMKGLRFGDMFINHAALRLDSHLFEILLDHNHRLDDIEANITKLKSK